MRTWLLLLFLLPSYLVSQVKILMPVVVKDSAGKSVTDLKAADFQVTGPKNISIVDLSVISPQTVSSTDPKASVVMIYDAVNIPTNTFDRNVGDLREFLADVASHRLPVTLLVNTNAGLRLVYNARTSPEVLSAALAATADKKTKQPEAADPKVEEQARNLL
jgi:hypothetical protein